MPPLRLAREMLTRFISFSLDSWPADPETKTRAEQHQRRCISEFLWGDCDEREEDSDSHEPAADDEGGPMILEGAA